MYLFYALFSQCLEVDVETDKVISEVLIERGSLAYMAGFEAYVAHATYIYRMLFTHVVYP